MITQTLALLGQIGMWATICERVSLLDVERFFLQRAKYKCYIFRKTQKNKKKHKKKMANEERKGPCFVS